MGVEPTEATSWGAPNGFEDRGAHRGPSTPALPLIYDRRGVWSNGKVRADTCAREHLGQAQPRQAADTPVGWPSRTLARPALLHGQHLREGGMGFGLVPISYR